MAENRNWRWRTLFAIAVASAWVAAEAGEPAWLLDGWRFARGGHEGAHSPDYDDSQWEQVRIPHDWAIAGPFDREIDKQTVAIVQNGEQTATEKTGRTGSLPWIGEGWYRLWFTVPEDCEHAELVFDGAMAEPHVFVDGKAAGGWAIGYNAFRVDVTGLLDRGAGRHLLAVRLRNMPESSRWYPGAGIYRPVRLVTGGRTGLATWGTFARTTSLAGGAARLTVTEQLRHRGGKLPRGLHLHWRLLDVDGREAAAQKAPANDALETTAVLSVPSPRLWTPETPHLYTLVTELRGADGNVVDSRRTRVGLRTVGISAEGFVLNGKVRKFKGVCLHHDLGPLGAAFNVAAFRRQVRLLKSMGCDSIRTAHNMPASWQMDVCDEMGMMVMAESFDMWAHPKCKNGYSRFFRDWWRRDLANLVLNHRNHPSVVMWSIGNEIPEQSSPDGLRWSRELQHLCHGLDPTRPVTQGLDRVDDAVRNGVLQTMDVAGLNYRLHRYGFARENAPDGLVLGSETASTVSSRGVYKFPVTPLKSAMHGDGQCSSYDVECCSWSNLPDDDWAMQDDNPWTMGEFVWTGFDYLGEPTPYDTRWPSRSSYFGIFDLAGLPKDRYWLYRSRWNEREPTLHLLPHWTFPGREGEITPVYCYTSHWAAELFVNGRSQGRRERNPVSRLDRYRLRWNEVRYEPGELKVVAYRRDGTVAEVKTVRTAGAPARIEVSADRTELARATGSTTPDMAFLRVRILDRDGNLCPWADNTIAVKTSGAVSFAAMCNGDATSLEQFTVPRMKAFGGELVAVVAAGAAFGEGRAEISARGLPPASVELRVK